MPSIHRASLKRVPAGLTIFVLVPAGLIAVMCLPLPQHELNTPTLAYMHRCLGEISAGLSQCFLIDPISNRVSLRKGLVTNPTGVRWSEDRLPSPFVNIGMTTAVLLRISVFSPITRATSRKQGVLLSRVVRRTQSGWGRGPKELGFKYKWVSPAFTVC